MVTNSFIVSGVIRHWNTNTNNTSDSVLECSCNELHQPVNWKYCYRVDEWLIPDLVQGYKLWTGKNKSTRMKRNTWRVNPIGDGTALEKRRGVKALGGFDSPTLRFIFP